MDHQLVKWRSISELPHPDDGASLFLMDTTADPRVQRQCRWSAQQGGFLDNDGALFTPTHFAEAQKPSPDYLPPRVTDEPRPLNEVIRGKEHPNATLW